MSYTSATDKVVAISLDRDRERPLQVEADEPTDILAALTHLLAIQPPYANAKILLLLSSTSRLIGLGSGDSQQKMREIHAHEQRDQIVDFGRDEKRSAKAPISKTGSG